MLNFFLDNANKLFYTESAGGAVDDEVSVGQLAWEIIGRTMDPDLRREDLWGHPPEHNCGSLRNADTSPIFGC